MEETENNSKQAARMLDGIISNNASTAVAVGIGRRTVQAMASMRDGLFKDCRKRPGTMVTGWTDGKGAVPAMWPGFPLRLASQELYESVKRTFIGTVAGYHGVVCDASTALELLGNELDGCPQTVRAAVGFDLEGSLAAEDAAKVRSLFASYTHGEVDESAPACDGPCKIRPEAELYASIDEASSKGSAVHVLNGDMGALGRTAVDYLVLIEVDLAVPSAENARRLDGVLRTAASIVGMQPVLTDTFPVVVSDPAYLWEAVARKIGTVHTFSEEAPAASPLHGMDFMLSATLYASGAVVNRALGEYLATRYELVPVWTYSDGASLVVPRETAEGKGECNAQ